jgi:hypothetical protein
VTRLEPAAYLTVDGVDVARSAAGTLALDRLLGGLLALDGLSVTWGRQEALDQQEPATASLELFDPTRSWHRSAQRIGAPVTLRWQVTSGGVTSSRVFFRGRVSRLNPRVATLAGVRGTRIALELTSLVSDLGNIVPPIAWPWENFGVVTTTPNPIGSRKARVSAAVVAAGISGGVTTRTDWDNFPAHSFPVDQQVSVAEHVQLLYDSLVDRMNYSPNANAFSGVGTRDYTTRRTLGRLASDPVGSASDRAGQGVYATARTIANVPGYGPGLYLDGRETGYPEGAGIVRDAGSAITRVRVQYMAATGGFPPTETATVNERIVAGSNETLTGIRTVTVDSLIETSAQYPRWETVVKNDVSSWQLEPITYDTGATGGFEDLAQVLALLSGEESNLLVFLQGSELPLMGVCPILGIMGGTITHDAGHWTAEATLAPITLVAAQHPISWEEFDTGTTGTQVQWWDTPHPLGLHESLTFEDLAWVGMGHGVPEPFLEPTYTYGDYLP